MNGLVFSNGQGESEGATVTQGAVGTHSSAQADNVLLALKDANAHAWNAFGASKGLKQFVFEKIFTHAAAGVGNGDNGRIMLFCKL